MEEMNQNENVRQDLVPEGKRACPVCGDRMTVETNTGISVDVCSKHGIWLDKGELPRIIDRMVEKSKLSTRKRKLSAEQLKQYEMRDTVLGYCPFFLDPD
jgi:Zn-finger nucleic acid-binding protein